MNTIEQFFGSIYKWMVVGVLVSAATAWLTANSSLAFIYSNSWYFYGVVGIELAILLGVQWMITRLSPRAALGLYVLYAALNGVTMAGFLHYFVAKDPQLVVVIFLVAASMFAFLAVVGYRTKLDMSGWGVFLMAGVWGVFISSIVNIWLQNDMMSFIISSVALVVFAALTVYDNQFYKNLFGKLENEEYKSRYATLGALHMYINFIMIFQALLNLTQLFGDE